jgi:hypothetical protein
MNTQKLYDFMLAFILLDGFTGKTEAELRAMPIEEFAGNFSYVAETASKDIWVKARAIVNGEPPKREPKRGDDVLVGVVTRTVSKIDFFFGIYAVLDSTEMVLTQQLVWSDTYHRWHRAD